MESNYHVFVSYSRHDTFLVRPIVNLLKSTGASVFRDEDNIPLGKKWRPIITQSIEMAKIFVIFWCEHSKDSKEVKKELDQAIKLNKEIIPVIMDSTRMIKSLSVYNGVDFRPFIQNHAAQSTKGALSACEGDEMMIRSFDKYVDVTRLLLLKINEKVVV